MKILTAFTLLALTLLASTSALADSRTWTSSSGTEIKAELLSLSESGDQVILKTEDGRTLTVPVAKLSEADRTFLAANPPAAPAPAPASSAATGEPSDAELERLTEILDKALEENPSDSERAEAEGIFARLLPDKGADGEAVHWDVDLPPSAGSDERTSVLISVDLYPEGADIDDRDQRLVWMHVVYQDKKPDIYGMEKLGRYPAMRMEDRHLFVLVGRTEVRAIADAESYESDAKLDALVKSMNLDAIKGL